MASSPLPTPEQTAHAKTKPEGGEGDTQELEAHRGAVQRLLEVPTDGDQPDRKKQRTLDRDQLLICPSWLRWTADRGCIRISVDNQLLADLCAGNTKLQSEHWRPVFRRILRDLQYILTKSCWTMNDPIGNVKWVRRHYNQLADYVAGKTLRMGRSWSHTFAPRVFDKPDCNLALFTDGGFRRGCGASAWVLCASYPKTPDPFVIFQAGGHYWDEACQMNSFTSELHALEEGVAALRIAACALSSRVAVQQGT